MENTEYTEYAELAALELDRRRAAFCRAMSAAFPEWDTALIVGKVNQYYFTGTMQDALLLIRKDGGLSYFARKSFERAKAESPLGPARVFPMNSYRDAAQAVDPCLGNTYIEGDTITYAMLERLQKHFHMAKTGNLDYVLRSLRAVKSPYELYWIEKSGAAHNKLLAEDVPALLREGMSEADFAGELFDRMTRRGYQGVSRFSRFQTEIVMGQFGFGENSIYPCSFDGPGGCKGGGAAVPVSGDPARRLKKGDLVFVDIGFGVNGYHSDKTQVYMFGGKPSDEAAQIHRACMDAQRSAAERLAPGGIPSRIYRDCADSLPDVLRQGFMGYGADCVKFLGHGVGLHIDEFPVIAQGFDEPLEANMAVALEPKKGLKGVGMLGVEETYIVESGGGRCVTGGARDIIVI
ncbi:MAG: Xaa-Pro peptidase family protein [Defluviitaleaceae bacterium]|nr:Xaa-Pro peptidase family protein [Defluviitaleaceae bacterium]